MITSCILAHITCTGDGAAESGDVEERYSKAYKEE